MSHFSKLKTSLKNRSALVSALEDLGFAGQVEVHENGSKLEGYEMRTGGQYANQKAEVIIRQKHLSGGYNDIGFNKAADGTYEAFISDPGMMKANRNKITEKIKGFGKEWLEALSQRYSLNVIKEQAAELGYSLEEHYEGEELVVRVEKNF